MENKKYYIIAIVFTVVLGGIFFAIAIISLFQPQTESPTLINPTPLQELRGPVNETTQPQETKTNPPIRYEPTAAQKMLDTLSAKTPLSASDSAAKLQILSLLPPGQLSGVVYRSPLVIVDYTNAADQFQAEILTVDIAKAKNDAVSWLRSQGLSQKAICDLPIVFYLSRDTLNQLRGRSFVFSPLAEEC
jgi:hypothetical protein